MCDEHNDVVDIWGFDCPDADGRDEGGACLVEEAFLLGNCKTESQSSSALELERLID